MPPRSLATKPKSSATVIFISHASADKQRLGPYIAHLLDRTSTLPGPVYVWIDRPEEVGCPAAGLTVGAFSDHPRILGLRSAVPWNTDITTAVTNCACVVIVYSERAAPEKNSIFASEILNALFEKKAVTISLDPIRKPEKPDILLQYIQWIDVSRFVSKDDNRAFDRAIDQIIDLISRKTSSCITKDTTASNVDLAQLAVATRSQRSKEIELLSSASGFDSKIVDRRYIADVFVDRSELAATLRKFIGSEGQTFVLLGDAGMGKTSFLCAAADELGTQGFTMFYLAIELHNGLMFALKRDLQGVVGEELDGERLSILAKEVLKQGKRFTIFVDGINEAPGDRQKLRAELNELVRQTEKSGLQWVISCRTIDWNYWLRNDNNMIGRFGRSVWSENNDNTASIVVGQFNDDESSLAWEKYRAEFDLVGEISPQLRLLCREPFMLRLVAEVYRGGKQLPVDVNAIELFDRYFAERFPDQNQFFIIYKVLMAAAKRTLEDGLAWIDVVGLSAEDFVLCQRLMQENVLVRRSDTHLRFRFELILEYLLAKWILSTVPYDARIDEKIRRVMAFSKSPNVNVVGAIENVLILWQRDEALVLELVEQLVQSQADNWKTMACSALRKMDKLPNNAERLVECLAADSNFVVRRYLVETLVRHAGEVSSIIQGLQEDAATWERRETAANWFRWAKCISTEAAVTELVQLGDDPHWRVRRAAGYALHERWANDPSTRVLMASNIESYTWRQRHAICIGLIGSSAAAGSPEGKAIKLLSEDDNYQVRWLIANYFAKYVGAEKTDLLQHLSTDKDKWVRGRMASSLISMDDSRRSSPAVTAALQLLSHDPEPAVRIRIARDLAAVADELWARKILSRYLADTPEVAFAAAYSLEGASHKFAIEFFGDHAISDGEAQLWILRERIAKGEVDQKTSRFGPLQEAISRVVELPAESDRYMKMIDSMTSLISAAADRVIHASFEQNQFFDLLCDDVDESVRWALVLYLGSFSDDSLAVDEKLRILSRLAADPHFWVRREVALAIGRWGDTAVKDQKASLLNTLLVYEQAAREPCRDEVLHYVRYAQEEL